MKYPLVSVIVPMYNAESTIEACLDSLNKLKYPEDKLEFVVVDNGSTDNSVAIASKYPVMIVEKIGGTIASVRNYGAKSASGEIFGFIDSDCVVYDDWLLAALKQLIKPGVAAAGAGYVTSENYSWVEKAWLYESKHEPFTTDFIPSGNFLIKADVFKSINGFNEELVTCEDAEIGLRIIKKGYKIINSSEIKSIHLRNPKTIKDFFKKEMWYGMNMMKTFELNYLDKVFIMSVLFFLAHIGIAAGVFQVAMYGNVMVLLGASSLLVTILITSTLYRIKRSRKYGLFFHTVTLYYFYFASRTYAVISYLTRRAFN